VISLRKCLYRGYKAIKIYSIHIKIYFYGCIRAIEKYIHTLEREELKLKVRIVVLVLIVELLLWFGISALLVFLASLAFGFKMSLFKVLFVFIAGIVIKGLMPSKE
jgi:hypothetical protein